MGLAAAVSKANQAEERQRELAREREVARVASRVLAGKSVGDPGQEELRELFGGLSAGDNGSHTGGGIGHPGIRG